MRLDMPDTAPLVERSARRHKREERLGNGSWESVVASSNRQMYAVMIGACVVIGGVIFYFIASFLGGLGGNGHHQHHSGASISGANNLKSDESATDTLQVFDGWDRLMTTFSVETDNGFYRVPIFRRLAKKNGWEQISSCEEGDSRTGALYMGDNELAALPMYCEETGLLVGVVLGTNGNDSMTDPFYEFKMSNGSTYFGVQFVFRNPKLICPSEITSSEIMDYLGIDDEDIDTSELENIDWENLDYSDLKEAKDVVYAEADEIKSKVDDLQDIDIEQAVDGIVDEIESVAVDFDLSDVGIIGDRLLIRNAEEDSSDSFYSAPLEENKNSLEEDGWQKGKCLAAMGTHYWNEISADTDCDEAYPVFLSYSHKQLSGFGIAPMDELFPEQTTKRWEEVSGSETSALFKDGEAPECVSNKETMFNMHVYLKNPNSMNCGP